MYLKSAARFYGYTIEDSREKIDELYDLEADIGEQSNLEGKSSDKVTELKELLGSIEGRIERPSDKIRTNETLPENRRLNWLKARMTGWPQQADQTIRQCIFSSHRRFGAIQFLRSNLLPMLS